MTGSAQTGSEAVRFRLLLGEKIKGEGLGGERARDWAGLEGWRIFFELLLAHFWTLFSCVVLERFLEALFGVPGSILGSFWTHFGHFFDDFWCQVRYARIALPLQRESNFRGSGGSRVPPSSIFFHDSILSMNFFRFLMIFCFPGSPQGYPEGLPGRSWGGHFRGN